jgi:pimeloyl-ACP methyl ester carboxylesterase
MYAGQSTSALTGLLLKIQNMKKLYTIILLMGLLALEGAARQMPARPPKGFISAIAKVNGVNIHYIKGGKGKPLVLLHGFGQNWYAWNRILAPLAAHFTLIVPDLRGIGESSRPSSGYEKQQMAADIHALVAHLGFSRINLAGHDIGEMVAYAYALSYPSQVEKLALLDTPLAGIEPAWSESKAFSWWWGFNSWPASASLVRGREWLFLSHFYPMVAHQHNLFTKAESAEFLRAYKKDGAMSCSFKWFAAFPADLRFNLEGREKLQMPVMAMSGEYSLKELANLVGKVATQVSPVEITGAGHWLMQENGPMVSRSFIHFFSSQ